MVDQNKGYVVFTEEMKKTHTILVPNMLPMHFQMIGRVLERVGYKVELLETSGPQIAETGLKYVHNDTCYPAILVIGQFIHALQSGKYDPDRVALILFQTGGGCRASNYIHLLRKALEKAGLGHVPVISLSMAGLEKHPGFQLTLPLVMKMMYGVLYGDLLMTLVNQCKPYEVEKGTAQALADRWTRQLAGELTARSTGGYRRVKANYRRILDQFAAIPMERRDTLKVGVVGEIFVKYSPWATTTWSSSWWTRGRRWSSRGSWTSACTACTITCWTTSSTGCRSSPSPPITRPTGIWWARSGT